jgi:hypothetical protein
VSDLLYDGPEDGPVFLFAHGAGAPMDSEFMEAIASGLAARGARVARFEFPYMARRREDGKKRGPDGMKKLEAAFEAAASGFDVGALFIGGKSMGGRVASRVAAQLGVKGVMCLGYPFHPPGKPERLRTAHLEGLEVPTLILQGERDPFGKPEEVEGYALSEAIEVSWLGDGDHSLKPRKRSDHTWEGNIEEATRQMWEFMSRV